MTQTPGGPAPQQPHEPRPDEARQRHHARPEPAQGQEPRHPHETRPEPPQGTIRLTIQGNELTAGMLTPTVVVSGHRVNSRFGTMDIPVWAGPNRVDIHTSWMKEYGQAGLDVQVRPGEVVPVFYAVPWHQFSSGSIGHEKQRRKGLGAFVALMAVIVLVPLGFVLLAWL